MMISKNIKTQERNEIKYSRHTEMMISKNIKTQERNEIKYSRHTENAGSFPLRDFGTIGDDSGTPRRVHDRI